MFDDDETMISDYVHYGTCTTEVILLH